MSLRVLVTDQAAREMQSAFDWWATNRSKHQADRWYAGLAKAIAELAKSPERHGLSRESERFPCDIRDLLFGIGRRPTHRAVFTIRDVDVVVLSIRHVSQRDLTTDDIEVD